MEYTFDDMLVDLKKGKEIDFEYKDQNHSILYSNGRWFYCNENQSVVLCDFEEKRMLASRIKTLIVQNETMENVINKRLYNKGTLNVL